MQTSDIVLKLPLNSSNREPDGSYLAQLQNPVNGSSYNKLFVALHELSMEYLPKNFTDRKNILYYRATDTEEWTALPVGSPYFVDNIQLILYFIQGRIPTGFKTKLKFEYIVKVNRVFVTLDKADMRFSPNLAGILGFPQGQIYRGGLTAKTVHSAVFMPNAMYRFEYLFLTCNFVSNSETPVGQMPLLRTLPIPTLDLGSSKRITIEFNERVYVPVISNYFNVLRFKFYDSQFKEIVDFVDNNENAYVMLKFKHIPFIYPV